MLVGVMENPGLWTYPYFTRFRDICFFSALLPLFMSNSVLVSWCLSLLDQKKNVYT